MSHGGSCDQSCFHLGPCCLRYDEHVIAYDLTLAYLMVRTAHVLHEPFEDYFAQPCFSLSHTPFFLQRMSRTTFRHALAAQSLELTLGI